MLIFAGAGWVYLNQQFVRDIYQSYLYTPSSQEESIQKNIQLTDKAAFLSAASHMDVSDAADFNTTCVQQESGNAILGCYANKRIYIYNVQNEKLQGIHEVTAAHELLHAAWDRLGDDERSRISELLEDAYQKVQDDDLRERMDYYSRTEPGERYNELHSILGTEKQALGTELEEYYSQYFKDRSVIVSYFTQYYSVFDSIQKQADALYDELTGLSKQIDQQKSAYESNAKVLSADIADFNARANNGGFSSAAQFNAARATLLNRISKLDSQYLALSAQIRTYNDKLEIYQNLALQQKELQKSIDSTSIVPTPSL